MAVGLDADTDYMTRGSIPSGGAGTLTDGAFANMFVGVWCYRPSSGNSIGLTDSGSIIHGVSGARLIRLGFDNTFGAGTAADPLLQVVFNSGGGSGAQQQFASANFLDEWVYYYYLENSTVGQEVGYIKLSDLATATYIRRTNDNAGSQYINTLYLGNAGTTTVVMGNYAYARAFYGTGIDTTDAVTYAGTDATVGGEWGFWPLADNTDTGDDSGNSRTLTFGGSLSSESDPTLGGGGGPTGHPLTMRLGGTPYAKAGPRNPGRTWKQRLSGIIHPDIPPLILPSYRTPRSFVSLLLPTRFA